MEDKPIFLGLEIMEDKPIFLGLEITGASAMNIRMAISNQMFRGDAFAEFRNSRFPNMELDSDRPAVFYPDLNIGMASIGCPQLMSNIIFRRDRSGERKSAPIFLYTQGNKFSDDGKIFEVRRSVFPRLAAAVCRYNSEKHPDGANYTISEVISRLDRQRGGL